MFIEVQLTKNKKGILDLSKCIYVISYEVQKNYPNYYLAVRTIDKDIETEFYFESKEDRDNAYNKIIIFLGKSGLLI